MTNYRKINLSCSNCSRRAFGCKHYSSNIYFCDEFIPLEELGILEIIIFSAWRDEKTAYYKRMLGL